MHLSCYESEVILNSVRAKYVTGQSGLLIGSTCVCNIQEGRCMHVCTCVCNIQEGRCMHVCICVCNIFQRAGIYMYVCVYAILKRASVYMYVCVYAIFKRAGLYMYVCVYAIFKRTGIYTCMYVCMQYSRGQVYIHVCMCVCKGDKYKVLIHLVSFPYHSEQILILYNDADFLPAIVFNDPSKTLSNQHLTCKKLKVVSTCI